ncbi:TM2 domain-containing protein [Dehalococcoidia bacterium]|nr:TM2 domain-containing protein [Dehalococcoidia bacterium]
MSTEQTSGKSFVATLILCILLGGLGVHRFYVGKVGTGIIMLLTLGGLGIWQLIDIIRIAIQKFKDSDGAVIKA